MQYKPQFNKVFTGYKKSFNGTNPNSAEFQPQQKNYGKLTQFEYSNKKKTYKIYLF